MTKKGAPGRNLYVRITENGQRKYVNVGLIFKSGRVSILKGMPNPGWWEE
jgi:hypothetical protein